MRGERESEKEEKRAEKVLGAGQSRACSSKNADSYPLAPLIQKGNISCPP